MSDVERIEGVVRKGMGAAADAIAIQKNLFVSHGLMKSDTGAALHNGTINLDVETPLVVFQPDFYLQRIEWQPGRFDAFRLTEICVSLLDSDETIPAFIYEASESPHICNPWLVEVLAPTMDGVAYGQRLRILFPRSIPLVRVLVRGHPDTTPVEVAMLSHGDQAPKQ